MAGPKFRDYLPPAPQTSTASVLRRRQPPFQADTFRSQILLSVLPIKDPNRIRDASIVTGHGTLGLRALAQTPVKGNNSRNFWHSSLKHHMENCVPAFEPCQHPRSTSTGTGLDGKLIQTVGMLQTGSCETIAPRYVRCKVGALNSSNRGRALIWRFVGSLQDKVLCMLRENGVVMCTAECERDEPARATSSPTQARTRRRRSPAPSSPMFEPSSTLPAIALPRPSMLSWYFFILYWGIGNRIRRDILGEERAGYVEQIVSTLSRQLTSDYGAGFSRPNLFHMIRFVDVWPDRTQVEILAPQLGWSHFKELLYLESEIQRQFYAEMCRVERWSVRTLREPRRGNRDHIWQRTQGFALPSLFPAHASSSERR